MSALRFRTHNQADIAVERPGYDIACLTERSAYVPNHVERHTSKLLKGLAIDYDPDVFEVHKRRFAVAHPGIPKRSPRRGTLWVKGVWLSTGTKVAVVCSHRINNASGPVKRSHRALAERLWKRHEALDARISRRLIKRGYVVLFGGDINNHTALLTPLTRAAKTFRHYDAIGYSGARLLSCETSSGGGSDHAAFTAIFDVR